MRSFLFALCLFLCSGLSLANNETLVVLPAETQVSFLGESDGTFRFDGIFELEGLLVARWGKSPELTTIADRRILYIQFFPEQKEIKKLPYINDKYNDSSRMISLNFNASESINNQMVKKFFVNIPNTFWQYKEGILEQPVRVKFDQFKAGDDCDYRYYYASIISLKHIDNISNIISDELVGCSNYLFSDTYIVNSKDGYANFRISPSTNAKVIQSILNDTLVEKLETQGNWLKVKIISEHQFKGTSGYIHKSQLTALE